MAHFAEIGLNNKVIQVIVINNDVLDSDGIEVEQKGRDFCRNLFGGTWIQTSYNGNFRGTYAGPEFTYDTVNDVFYPPKPYAAWTLNNETWDWEPPTLPPQDDNIYEWDSDANNWTAVE
jgi:hypothetical protein